MICVELDTVPEGNCVDEETVPIGNPEGYTYEAVVANEALVAFVANEAEVATKAYDAVLGTNVLKFTLPLNPEPVLVKVKFGLLKEAVVK